MLGPGVVVEPGAQVLDSVMLDDTVVEAGAVVAGAICDRGSRIGSDACVGQSPAPDQEVGPDDVVVVAGEVEVPAGVAVGPGSRLTAR